MSEKAFARRLSVIFLSVALLGAFIFPYMPQAAGNGPAGYTFCSDENGTCNFSGTATVAYGANGSFFYKTFVNGTACNNDVFGDPIYGTPKACYYQLSGGGSDPSAAFQHDPNGPTVEVTSYTNNPNCNSCWGPSVSAKPGDTISVLLYYTNSGGPAPIKNVRGNLSTSGDGQSVSVTGVVSADNASPISGTVTVNSTDGPIRLVPQSATSFNFGDADTSGPTCWGQTVVRFTVQAVNVITQPSTCTASLNWNTPSVNSGGSATETWSVQGADFVTGVCTGLAEHNISPGPQSFTFNNISQPMTCTVKGFINNQQACSASATVNVNNSATFTATATASASASAVCPNGTTAMASASATATATSNISLADAQQKAQTQAQAQAQAQATANAQVVCGTGNPPPPPPPQLCLTPGAINFGGPLPCIFPPPPPPPPPPPATLVCIPASQTVNINSTANFVASGGNGTFSWSVPGGSPASGSGQVMSSSFSAAGNYTAIVTSGGQTATCSTSVINIPPPPPPCIPPTAQTLSATQVGQNSAVLNGSVNPNGSAASYRFEWGTDPNNLNQMSSFTSVGSGNSAIPVSLTINNLNFNTTYYFRIVVQSNCGTANGTTLSFTTGNNPPPPPPPPPQCIPPTPITQSTSAFQTSATLFGQVNPNGNPTSYRFEYGTSPGFLNNSTGFQSADSFQGFVPVSQMIGGLQSNTTYYYRLVAVSNCGLVNGNILSFRTSGIIITSKPPKIPPTGGESGIPATLTAAIDRCPTISARNPLLPGDEISYTVTYKNPDKSSIRNAILNVTIPFDTQYDGSTPPATSESQNVLSFNLGTIPGNSQGTVVIKLKVKDSVANGTILPFNSTLEYKDSTNAVQDVSAPTITLQVGNQSNQTNNASSASIASAFGNIPGYFWLFLLLLFIILLIAAYFFRLMSERRGGDVIVTQP